MSLDAALSPIALEVHGPVELPQRFHDFLEDRGKQKQVHEIGVELRATTFENDLRCRRGISSRPVSARVRDGVIGIDNAHDARAERNLRSREAARITTSIPTFMMAQHPFPKVGIEPGKWFEHFSAPLRMRGDELPFTRGELATFPNDIEQCGMNFSNVVEQRDTFDATAFVLIEVGRPGENQRIGRHATQVRTCFMIIRVDRIEQGLEGCGREAFGGTPSRQFSRGKHAADGTHGDAGEGTKDTLFFRHWVQARQELGDMTREQGRLANRDRKLR